MNKLMKGCPVWKQTKIWYPSNCDGLEELQSETVCKQS